MSKEHLFAVESEEVAGRAGEDDWNRVRLLLQERIPYIMANFLRLSHEALSAIPADCRVLVHSMFEDNDLYGAEQAEKLFACLELANPGQLVGIVANDSVSPPCCSKPGHFKCDYYDPYWYTVFVKASAWQEYQAAVLAKEAEWKAAHQCHERVPA